MRACIFCALLASLVLGCASSTPPPTKEGVGPGENLGKVYRAYRQAAVKLKRAPKDVKELTPHMEDKSNQALISPRDGQEYVIVWGVDLLKLRPDPVNPLVFAYERKGQDGMRYVLTETGPRLMAEADFRRAQFPQGHQPQID